MGPVLSFDVHDPESLSQLGVFGNYGKLRGYLRAHQWGLAVASRGAVVSQTDGDFVERVGLLGTTVLCRPDAPVGEGNALPRGRDLPVEAIPSFLKEVQHVHPAAVLLAFAPAALEITGTYLPRYCSSGGANVLVRPGNEIVFEYVGDGFDAGDLTRGQAVHWSTCIDWDNRFEGAKRLFMRRRALLRTYYEATDEQYTESRRRRIADLVVLCGAAVREDAERMIPTSRPQLSIDALEAIYSSGLEKLILELEAPGAMRRFGNDGVVMMNLYGAKAYVFEVWSSARFIRPITQA